MNKRQLKKLCDLTQKRTGKSLAYLCSKYHDRYIIGFGSYRSLSTGNRIHKLIDLEMTIQELNRIGEMGAFN